jgi:uncharacterized protein YecT (DUF1311 family)
MILKVTAFLLGCFLLAGPASSEDLCQLDGPQVQMNQCALERFEAADRKLNEQWKKLVKASSDLDPEGRILRDAQKSWIVYRDKMCQFYNPRDQAGSIFSMLFNLCMERLTIEQTKQLSFLCEDQTFACEK